MANLLSRPPEPMPFAELDPERLAHTAVRLQTIADSQRALEDSGRRAEQGLIGLLDRVEASLDEIEAFAVSIGPGSFTGLRIGLATLKGLAFGSDRLAVAVPTLAALTLAAAGAAGPVAALLDARRDEVYAACLAEPGDIGTPLVPDAVFTAEELAAALPHSCTVVVGEGAEDVAAAAAERAGGGMQLLPTALGRPRAFHTGLLGARLLARGEGQRSEDLVPRYLRRAEAEVRRTGERFEEPAG